MLPHNCPPPPTSIDQYWVIANKFHMIWLPLNEGGIGKCEAMHIIFVQDCSTERRPCLWWIRTGQ